MSVFTQSLDAVAAMETRLCRGTVDAVRGMTIVVRQLKAPIGAVVAIECGSGGREHRVRGEVIGFDGNRAIVMLLGGAGGIGFAFVKAIIGKVGSIAIIDNNKKKNQHPLEVYHDNANL